MAIKKGVDVSATEYQSWHTWLRRLGIEATNLKFTKKGELKEFLINGINYSVEQHQRFNSFIRDLMRKSIKQLKKMKVKLPEWVTFKPYIPKIYYI